MSIMVKAKVKAEIMVKDFEEGVTITSDMTEQSFKIK